MRDSRADRDSLGKIKTKEIMQRIDIAKAVLWDGIKECAGESSLKEVIRQLEVLSGVYRDRAHPEANKTDIGDIVVTLKPLGIRARRV